MTSTAQRVSPNRSNPSSTSSAGANLANSATGSTLAQQGQKSFPTATDFPSSSPNASEPINMSAAVGGAPATHGHSDSVNGRTPTIPAIPSVNGNVSLPDHNRKPSMTVTPAGVTSFTSNGATQSGPQNKIGGIQFGALGSANPASSPAMGTPAQLAHNPANLGVNQLNPPHASPSNSPSPIPQPAHVSGGRPPSSFQGQGHGFQFGQTGGDSSDPSVRYS
jgi:translation initiation factor 4G